MSRQGMFPLRVESAAAKQHLGESSHRDAVMPGLQTSFVSEDTYPIGPALGCALSPRDWCLKFTKLLVVEYSPFRLERQIVGDYRQIKNRPCGRLVGVQLLTMCSRR